MAKWYETVFSPSDNANVLYNPNFSNGTKGWGFWGTHEAGGYADNDATVHPWTTIFKQPSINGGYADNQPYKLYWPFASNDLTVVSDSFFGGDDSLRFRDGPYSEGFVGGDNPPAGFVNKRLFYTRSGEQWRVRFSWIRRSSSDRHSIRVSVRTAGGADIFDADTYGFGGGLELPWQSAAVDVPTVYDETFTLPDWWSRDLHSVGDHLLPMPTLFVVHAITDGSHENEMVFRIRKGIYMKRLSYTPPPAPPGSPPPPPTNTVAPAITDPDGLTVGNSLLCDGGTWSDTGSGAAVRYQWQRDNLGGGTYADIPGATFASYLLQAADTDCNIRCHVTDNGTGPVASNHLGPVVAGGGPAPSGGLVVGFTDESSPGPSGPIVAWSWDFGDGDVSLEQSPTHFYPSPGSYDVTLTVTGSGPDGTAVSPISTVTVT